MRLSPIILSSCHPVISSCQSPKLGQCHLLIESLQKGYIRMTRYILGRLLSLLFVLLVVSLITFSLMHAVPGGPFDEDKQPLPPAAKANIMRKYGLDQPYW